MNLASHVDQLRQKHEALDTQIREEQRRPGIDHLAITALKREKLHLKEQIERLSTTEIAH